MRDHGEEASSAEIKEDEENSDDKKSGRNRSTNLNEDETRGFRKESVNENYRDLLINVEDQVETSKLVLQLVTDSRFNMTQINGQRKLGGPPPGWKGPAPGPGCEVFVGKIPRTLYEHEIYPIFRRMGEVYEIRLMMDFSGTNRGYCFVMFGKPEFAKRAIKELDNFEIRPGRRIGVVASINNCRLYVGQLPPDVTSENVIRKIYDITDDVGQVSVYRNANDQARYALISYKTHRGAAMARRRLVPDRASLFGGSEVSVDWAHPSMFPSNVVEDTGVSDDHGNIEITRLVVGSENKRYQNRRRVRDDFLDHSIRAYLQSDRALEHLPRNKQNFSPQNQSFNNCLAGINRGINNFHLYDQNLNSPAQSYARRNNSAVEKHPCKIDNPGKSRESNSSFDLNVGSGSSECSGSSSLSSASEKHHNLSKEFLDSSLTNFYHPQIFYPVDNNSEIFPGQVEGEILGGDMSRGKKDPESLNLFDNYTYSVNSREADFNEVENTQNDFSSLVIFEKNPLDNEAVKIYNGEENYAQFFERGNKFPPNISSESNTKRGYKTVRENERKSREQRCKNFLNRENNNSGENWHKSARRSSKSQSFQDLETFPKTVGVPVKNEIRASTALNIPSFPRQQNRNGICSLVWNKNGKNSNSAARLVVAENCLTQQQLCENAGNRSAAYAYAKIGNFSNARNFSHNVNSNGKRFSAKFSQNVCDFSLNNFGNASVNTPVVCSDFETSTSGFIPQGNSQVMNFCPVQNFSNFAQNCFYQNNKFLNGKNLPKNGRPILNRSHVSLRNEN